MNKIFLLFINLISFLSLSAQTYREDVNSDNSIDISDVNTVINVICGQSTPTTYNVQSADNWYFNLENLVVTKYMNEVDYSDSIDNYTISYMPQYRDITTSFRKDQPSGVLIYWNNSSENQSILISRKRDFSVLDDSISVYDNVNNYCLYNLLPGEIYYYKVISNGNVLKKSHFFTTGQVRMIKLNSLCNVRDLGGWLTEDGHKLKYGRLFRGGEMNTSRNPSAAGLNHDISSEDSIYMHDVMNIRFDMDLRDSWDLFTSDNIASNNLDHTVLGKDVDYYHESVLYLNDVFKKTGTSYNLCWGRTIKKVINALSQGKNVYIHCTWGADRTGMLSMLLEGLCGVSEADIQKDYELTSMYSVRYRTIDYWGANIQFIKSFEGTTFRDKVESYCKKAGVTQDEIETLRNVMLE